jgi:peptidoglycan/LPS O-acetylase OafA/YrhL
MNLTNPFLKNQDMASGQNRTVFSSSTTHALEENQRKKHIFVLDGIRAIACLAVLTYHMNLVSTGFHLWHPLLYIHTLSDFFAYFATSIAWFGESGVILFFLLSGFLLFLPFAKALLFGHPWPSLRRFYIRRIFRIIPGYYTALFLIVLFFHPQFLYPVNWQYLWIFLTFRMNFALSQYINGPFWTLAIEFQFYLLLPILAWFFSLLVCHGTARWRLLKLTLCLLLMIAWGLFTRYWAIYIARTSTLNFLIPHHISIALVPYLYSDTGTYSEVFAVGMLTCMIYTYIQYASSVQSWYTRMRRLSPLMLTAGLALFSFLSFWHFYFIDTTSRYFAKFPRSYVVFTFLNPHILSTVLYHWGALQALGYALSYACCLLALLYGSAKIKRPFECSLLRWIASISFSLYMWHLPFLGIFINVVGHNLQRLDWDPLIEYAVFWCWILVVILPISAMLYRWIEQPGIQLGEWLISKLGERKLKSSIRLHTFFTSQR